MGRELVAANWDDTLERVGEVGVDSGTVWVGDPCYLVPSTWDGPEGASKPGDWHKDWCDHFPHGKAEVIEHKDGVWSQTTYGDGCYPVYAIMTRDGRVRGLFVDFDAVIPVDED